MNLENSAAVGGLWTNPGSTDYCTRALTLLAKYQWIYDFQLTNFLCDRVWENIPPQWLDSLCQLTSEELNCLPYGLTKHEWPTSLREFVQEAETLSFPRIPAQQCSLKLEKNSQRGMKPKKIHEVKYMSTLVHEVCQEVECNHIVDVGAGLGYLSHTLYEQCGYKVLALECEESRTHGAENRANKLDLSGIKSTTFQLENTQKSFNKFEEIVSRTFEEPVTSVSTRGDTSGNKLISNEKFCQNGPDDMKGIRHCASAVTCTYNCGEVGASSHFTKCDIHKSMRAVADTDFVVNHKHEMQQPGIDKLISHDSHSVAHGQINGCNAEGKIEKNGQALLNRSVDNICMIGLHCCGSLTPAMLDLFLLCPRLKSLVCVSCCYHSMPVNDEGKCSLFPLSEAFKKSCRQIEEVFPKWKMSTYALRLAAQETRSRWRNQTDDDHEFHIKNVGYRALLEMFSERDSSFVKLKRRIARRKDFKDFDTYLKTIFKRTSLSSEHYDQLNSLHEDFKEYFKYIEPFTVLQVLLQPVLETLISVDRLAFLKEHGVNCKLVPIFDEAISPRNLAIVAVKD